MKTLTPQIAAMYYGAELQCAPYADNKKLIIGKMVGLNSYICDVKFPEWQHIAAVTHEYCKLILTPISEITDEDAVIIASILTPGEEVDDEFREGVEESKNLYASLFTDSKFKVAKNTISPTLVRDVYNYLRSKSYDCDNLIESGMAVKK